MTDEMWAENNRLAARLAEDPTRERLKVWADWVNSAAMALREDRELGSARSLAAGARAFLLRLEESLKASGREDTLADLRPEPGKPLKGWIDSVPNLPKPKEEAATPPF